MGQATEDRRVSFSKAQKKLRGFLRGVGLPDQVLWLSEDRVIGHPGKVWIYRPLELADESASAAFYEHICDCSRANIRIDVLTQYEGHSVCYVEDCGDSTALLNFGTKMNLVPMVPVDSRSRWLQTKLYLSTCRDSHEIHRRRITPACVSA